jgi:hypothetical protein
MGKVVPEPVFTRAVYEHGLLAGIYQDIAPLDPDGILHHEWLNARGAIARFMRGSIEIRLIDLQEYPAGDLAVLRLIAETIRALAEERYVSIEELKQLPTDPLAALLLRTTRQADLAELEYAPLLRALGMSEVRTTCGEVWASLAQRLIDAEHPLYKPLATIFQHGTLARRILKDVGEHPTLSMLHQTYDRLANTLDAGEMFIPA